MSRFKHFYLLLILLSSPTFATTWDDGVEVDDPILEGKKCVVSEYMSYGNYIYHYPSKYEQVFWPETSSRGIWFCEHSGFTAIIHDFKITDEQKKKIKIWLAENYKGKTDMLSRLKYIDAIYGLRDQNKYFQHRKLRFLAHWYEKLKKPEIAKAYRQKAMLTMQASLKTKLDPPERVETLYVLANYSRYLGDVAASDAWLAELNSALIELRKGKYKDFAEYITDLAKETPRIKPGKLIPERDKK